MIEIVNKPYSYTFKNYASKNKKILCLSGDLTSSCEVDQFRDEFPNQFVSMGMAEQNMMSFAGGIIYEWLYSLSFIPLEFSHIVDPMINYCLYCIS